MKRLPADGTNSFVAMQRPLSLARPATFRVRSEFRSAMLLRWIQRKRAASNDKRLRSREQSLRQELSSNCPKCGDPLTSPWIKQVYSGETVYVAYCRCGGWRETKDVPSEDLD